MKATRVWLLAGAGVCLIGLASVGQTAARWHGSADIGGTTITSGRLSILAGDSDNYRWTDFGGANLAPNAVVQKPLTVANDGTIDLDYRLHAVTVDNGGVPLTFTAWIVATATACPTTAAPTGPAGGPWTTFPTPVSSLSAGDSDVWCLRATVGPTAQPNRTSTVTVDFRADQQR